jgi:ABC-type glutathione transport system ATPase component
MTEPICVCEHVDITYPGRGWRHPGYHIIKDVSVDIRPGECVGLVGESGSGKTTLGRGILGLAPVTGGSIRFEGREIANADRATRKELSSDIQVVFQDPYSSLNPSMTIEQILTEPMTVRKIPKNQARARVRDLLDEVKLPKNSAERKPKEFSGGQRQRIAIARALALDPKLIVCDEPVSALDLSTQARVLDLLLEIQRDTGVAYLFISHDLAVVHYLSHRIAVMQGGRIVEWGDGDQISKHPKDPYTQRLMMAAPVPDPDKQAERRRERHQLAAATAGG